MSSLFKNEDQFLSVCQYLKYIFSEYYDCTLYLLAITHEDHKILSVVSQLIENSIIVPLLSPSATKNIVSQLDMLITSRYHGCVFGASQGIPTIGLYSEEYWKNKNMGVLEMFGCKNAVFSICDIQSSNMEDKISEFLLTPDFIRHEMKQKKSVLMKKSYFVHNKIFEIYENTLG
jgi:polysaccharide pyruvyl transferase WcaK-like protein